MYRRIRLEIPRCHPQDARLPAPRSRFYFASGTFSRYSFPYSRFVTW